jgi:hypothetical protein
MPALLFDSLEIRGFRAFQDLRIEKLGRVNLIVGQNNVGKSCLLEALQLYASRARPSFLWQLLEAHGEAAQLSQSGNNTEGEMLSIISNLFYDWPEMTELVPPIEIGPIDSPSATLRLSLGFFSPNSNETGQTTLQQVLPEGYGSVEKAFPCFSVQLGQGRQIIYPLEAISTCEPLEDEIPPINCILSDAHSLSKREISALWDKIASPEVDEEILNALRVLAPGLNAIHMVGNIGTKHERFPVVTAATIAKPLPIWTLGTGIQRTLAIMLALLNAKDGLLLIDEIEHGLHYTAQVELWLLIFEIARRLNVQVFATSHSWDCIVSFQAAVEEITQQDEQAVLEDKQTEAMLFRLSLKTGNMRAVIYDKRKLAIAARQNIEVR